MPISDAIQRLVEAASSGPKEMNYTGEMVASLDDAVSDAIFALAKAISAEIDRKIEEALAIQK